MKFLRDMALGEMIAITEQWTGPLQSVFASIPEIAGLFPRVQEDHEALLTAGAGSSAEALFRTLSDRANALDERHDHLQRGLSYLLLGAREILLGVDPPESALEDQIGVAQARLQPQGLEIIKASYEGEAGNAAQMVNLADTELAPVLSQIPVITNITALDLVHVIGEVGATLGTVEHEKSVTEAAAKKEAIAPAEVKRRMRQWADTVEAVLAALVRSKAPEAAVIAIQKPVQDAADKARTRRLAQRNAAAKKNAGATDAKPADKATAEKGDEKAAAKAADKPVEKPADNDASKETVKADS